jgi:predicted TIM-barrel fold metal-dependent hydrolase
MSTTRPELPRVVDINRLDDVSHAACGGMDECWVLNTIWRQSTPPHQDGALMNSNPRGDLRLRRQTVLLPPDSEGEGVERALHSVDEGAPRLVRLCPGRYGHNYILADWVLRPLPEMCESAGLSLAVDYVDRTVDTPWVELLAFAHRYPSLPIVLLGAAIDEDRSVAAALDRAPNLILEISRVANPEALGPLAARFGAHRFVFGSDGEPDALTRWSSVNLRPEERAEIFGGNALALDNSSWQRTFL